MKRFYTRQDWRADSASGPMAAQGRVTEVFVHHTADRDAGIIDSLAAQRAAMQRTQQFHIHGRGWSDIAYHAIVFQPRHGVPLARVFLGRPANRVPAAQEGHNTGTLAIAVYGDFTRETMDANTRYAIEQTIKRLAPKAKTLGGHRDVVSTACPGDHIYDHLDRIARASGLKRYPH